MEVRVCFVLIFAPVALQAIELGIDRAEELFPIDDGELLGECFEQAFLFVEVLEPCFCAEQGLIAVMVFLAQFKPERIAFSGQNDFIDSTSELPAVLATERFTLFGEYI